MLDKHVFKCTSELNTLVVISTAGLVLLWTGLDAVPWTSWCSFETHFCTCRDCYAVKVKPTFPGRSETSCAGLLQSLGQRCPCTLCQVSDRRKGNPVKTIGWYFRLSLGHCVLLKVMPSKSSSSCPWVNTRHCDFYHFVPGSVYNVMVNSVRLKPLPLTCRIISDIHKRLWFKQPIEGVPNDTHWEMCPF